jgi:hypothetical protein
MDSNEDSVKIVGFCQRVADDLEDKNSGVDIERERACRKVPYDTVQDAYRIIRQVNGRKKRKESKVYKCACGKYHLTSQRS